MEEKFVSAPHLIKNLNIDWNIGIYENSILRSLNRVRNKINIVGIDDIRQNEKFNSPFNDIIILDNNIPSKDIN